MTVFKMNKFEEVDTLLTKIILNESVECWEAKEFLSRLYLIYGYTGNLNKHQIYRRIYALTRKGFLDKTLSKTKKDIYEYTSTSKLLSLKNNEEDFKEDNIKNLEEVKNDLISNLIQIIDISFEKINHDLLKTNSRPQRN